MALLLIPVSSGVCPCLVPLFAISVVPGVPTPTIDRQPVVDPEKVNVTLAGSPPATVWLYTAPLLVPSSAAELGTSVQPAGGVTVIPVPITRWTSPTSPGAVTEGVVGMVIASL